MGLDINRATFARIERDIHQEAWRIKTVARSILRAGVMAGYRTTHQALIDAHTYTGRLRELANQGQAGRVRSGQLVSDLGFFVGSEDEAAWVGWPIEQESYDYAAAQDTGRYGARFIDDERGHVGGRPAVPRIPPAGALWEGAIVGRETIREMMIAAGFKPTGRVQ